MLAICIRAPGCVLCLPFTQFGRAHRRTITHTRTRAHAKQKNKCRASRCDRSIADRLLRLANVCVCARASVRQRSANTRAHTHVRACGRGAKTNECQRATRRPTGPARHAIERHSIRLHRKRARSLGRAALRARQAGLNGYMNALYLFGPRARILFFFFFVHNTNTCALA